MPRSSLFESSLLQGKQFLSGHSALLKLIGLLFSSLEIVSERPLRLLAQPRNTFNASLCSLATSRISATYSPNPNCSKALVMCSQAIVFLASFSEISFASEDISVMNSTQHSMRRSRASLPNAMPEFCGRISETIF